MMMNPDIWKKFSADQAECENESEPCEPIKV